MPIIIISHTKRGFSTTAALSADNESTAQGSSAKRRREDDESDGSAAESSAKMTKTNHQDNELTASELVNRENRPANIIMDESSSSSPSQSETETNVPEDFNKELDNLETIGKNTTENILQTKENFLLVSQKKQDKEIKWSEEKSDFLLKGTDTYELIPGQDKEELKKKRFEIIDTAKNEQLESVSKGKSQRAEIEDIFQRRVEGSSSANNPGTGVDNNPGTVGNNDPVEKVQDMDFESTFNTKSVYEYRLDIINVFTESLHTSFVIDICFVINIFVSLFIVSYIIIVLSYHNNLLRKGFRKIKKNFTFYNN